MRIATLPMQVLIRPPTAADEAEFRAAARRSRALHRGWVSPPTTAMTYRRYLQRISGPDHRGFLVIHKATGELAGVINISNIIRGAFCSAFLGYYAFSDHVGRGLMLQGMRLALRHAFGKLKLHRVEANIQPGNLASLALVQRCGFVKEGFSRRYLKIGGKWKDHERWALLAEDFKKRSAGKGDQGRLTRAAR